MKQNNKTNIPNGQYAIRFAKWMIKEKFELSKGHFRSSLYNGGMPYTAEELHLLFETQTNKQ